MRSLRTVSLLMEGILLLFVIILIMTLFSLVTQQIVAQTTLGMEETMGNLDASIRLYLQDREEAFKQLSDTLDDTSSNIVMPTFSDLYFTDKAFRVTEVLQQADDSLIFPGFDQSYSGIGQYLQNRPVDNVLMSPMLQSLEFSYPSVYFVKRRGEGYLFGRLSLKDLTGLLTITAQNLDSILIVSSPEGYILASTSLDLPFHVMPDPSVNEYKGYWITRYDSEAIGNELILLKPSAQVYRTVAIIRRYYPLYFALFILLIFGKLYVQDAFMIRPIRHFVDVITSWSIHSTPKRPTGLLMKTREFKLLYEHFRDKTQSISTAFQDLDEAKQQALEAEADLKASEEELQTMNEELEARIAIRSRELEQVYDKLMQQEKMASIGALVAGVSHEINTPVGICVTATSYLSEQFRKLVEKHENKQLTNRDFKNYQQEAQESLKILSTSLDRASTLISSFKEVAVGQSIEEPSSFNLKEQLDLLIISLRHEYKYKQHYFTIDCPDDLVLFSYIGTYTQIFTNLIMNALIHGLHDQEKGEIHIAISQSDGFLHIDFSDSGKGMPEADLRRVFEPFYTTNRAGGGSGLGLYIVYNLVTQQLGGTIRCHSTRGKGTTFHLELPLTTPTNKPDDPV